MIKLAQDSLDQQQELFQRAQSGPSSPIRQDQLYNQNQIYKNFYRQQLDDLVQQKAEQKRLQKQKEERERASYNERIAHTMEAERMKDLSYKNYYQMLLSNQSSISRNYVSPFDEKLQEKDKLIQQGVEEEKVRREALYEQQQRRLEEQRKNYREYLADQINEKYNRSAVDSSARVRENEDFKKVTYTPQQLARFERQRKVMEMQRYKQDLDKTNNSGRRERAMSNPNASLIKNDFNVMRVEDRHNPMVNPLPYNIQNPYILREMKRKGPLEEDGKFY